MASKPYNILYFSSFGSLWGGGQISLFHLVDKLDKERFHPYVCLPSEGPLAGKLRDQGVEVAIVPLPKVIDLKAFRPMRALYSVLRLTFKHRIDLIHTDGPRNTFYAGLAARIKRLPIVWHVRASTRDPYDYFLYCMCSRVILVANALKSRFDWGSGGTKLITIHNGIELAENDREDGVSLRGEYRIPASSLVIAAMGRIERNKGQKYLIEACGKLKNTGPDFRLVLAGEIIDPGYLEECRATAGSLGIQDRVVFTGYLKNTGAFLNAVDIFVSPSLSEAFPRTPIEAMGAAKPVIVTDVGGCAEAVEDGVSGFVVPPADPQTLCERLLALAQHSDLREEMGRAGRRAVESKFSIEENVRKTQSLYGSILGYSKPMGST